MLVEKTYPIERITMKVERYGDFGLITPAGALTGQAVDVLKSDLMGMWARGTGVVVLDLNQVETLDLFAVGAIIDAVRDYKTSHGILVIALRHEAPFYNVFKRIKFDRGTKIFQSYKDAFDYLTKSILMTA
jgi:anti-anti-sigma regulatory factor